MEMKFKLATIVAKKEELKVNFVMTNVNEQRTNNEVALIGLDI